jgi:1,4-dihydroxy-6-naphthoate synthase
MTTSTATTRTISLGHSPDPDDAFMFYALAKGLIDTGPYRFEHRLADIETLNRQALAGELDVTAVSYHAYPRIAADYALLACGSSMGDGYGPLLVGREVPPDGRIGGDQVVAIPGELTSAHLALQLWAAGVPDGAAGRCEVGRLRTQVVAFDEIPAAVARGDVDLGVLIHEGQLTYADEGLAAVVDLGAWWRDATGLPLPLGANAIRRALGPVVMREVAALLRQSIHYALEHRDDAVDYSLAFGRGLDTGRALRFIGMYVNQLTLDLGERGRHGVEVFLAQGRKLGMIPAEVPIEFIDERADGPAAGGPGK